MEIPDLLRARVVEERIYGEVPAYCVFLLRAEDVIAQKASVLVRVLVLRGEAGIGKTALLRYDARQAAGFRVVQVVGVQAEMELPLSGIQRLWAPIFFRDPKGCADAVVAKAAEMLKKEDAKDAIRVQK